MAAGNKVTLTFAGELDKSLQRSVDGVGKATRDMADSADAGVDRLGRLEEAGGTTETRFLGLGAGISGVSTLLSGDLNAETAAMAMADLGDAVEHTVAPLLKHAKAWIQMGIQATINGARIAAGWIVAMGPVGWVIAGVAAIIGILALLGVSFDDVKNAAKGVWNWIKRNWPMLLAILTGPIGIAVLVIKRHGNSIVSFFAGLPGRIARVARGMWDGITSAFKSAINGVIRAWNNFSIGLSFGGKKLPGPIPDIPAFSFRINTPNIPYLHTGGVFQAPTGQREGLAMLAHGERVLPAGAGTTVVIDMRGAIVADDREFERMVVRALRRAGAKGVPLTTRGRSL